MLYLKLVLMAVFWSGVFPAVNIALRSMSVYTTVFLRFWWAAVLLLILLRWREHRLARLSPRETVLVIGLGLLGISLYNTLFTAGLALVEASRAAVIVATNPSFTALIAALFLKERLGGTRLLGVVLSLLGGLWVLCRGDPQVLAEFELGRGEFFLISCVFVWSAYALVGRIALSSLSPLALTAYVMAVGSLPLAVPVWLEGDSLFGATWEGWMALAYLVLFGTVMTFQWFYEGVKELGAARASQFINLVPVLAVIESVLILGEPMTPALIVGGALVFAGLYLTNRPR